MRPDVREELIIDQPERQSRMQKYVHGFITLCFWFFYLYLLTPLITIALWVGGAERTFKHFVELEGYTGLFDAASFAGLGIALIAILINGWQFYNFRRFRNKQRHSKQELTDKVQLAAFFGVATEDTDRAQLARRLVVHYDENAKVTDIECSGSIRKA